MFKRKRRRSAEFKRNSQVIDIEEARSLRQERREQRALEEKRQQELAEEKKLSARRKKQKRNRRLIYLGAIVLIFGLAAYCIWDIVVLSIEKEDVLREQQALLQEKERLQQEINNVNDPKYIEQQARLQLRLIMPGETLFVLPKPDESAGGDSSEEEARE